MKVQAPEVLLQHEPATAHGFGEQVSDALKVAVLGQLRLKVGAHAPVALVQHVPEGGQVLTSQVVPPPGAPVVPVGHAPP